MGVWGGCSEACTYPHGTRAPGPLSEKRVSQAESGGKWVWAQRAGNLNVPAPKGTRQSDP